MMFAERGDKSIWLKAQRDRKITQTESGEILELICNSISFGLTVSRITDRVEERNVFSWQTERETEMNEMRKKLRVGENE